ncbi:XV phospholipase A2 [Seminavis robusta]|uniref:XV phospholipase A2 n=1 Tax=Seminavis robusta TaxID=568900 RepID=A0A9N8E4B3_9STRA|nr:XV phospholipase A2 [Seminavis robusta]|eukprot:Sro634_g179050.1 XV phospholipase A2 (398) ;mRNA; f:51772-52965
MMFSRITESFLLLFVLLLLDSALAAPSPVVLVPGDGASVLEARFEKETVPHIWCSKSTHGKWKRIWIPNPVDLLPKTIDCWSDTMMRHYNDTHVFNTRGVEIRPKPGTLIRNTYKKLIDALTVVKVLTYDFRVAPNHDLMTELKQTVEDLYHTNNGSSKVTVISHSMGGLHCHYFFTRVVDQAWKDQYIHAWIPMSPAYGGVVYGLKQVISGDHVHIPWLTNKDLVQEQRSCEGSLWLLPRPEIYGNEVLVQTPQHNYTAHNYSTLLTRAAGFTAFDHQWSFVKDLTAFDDDDQKLADPHIPVYPMYGFNRTTVHYYRYGSSLAEEPEIISTLQGDTIVNKASLEAGNHWSQAKEPLVVSGIDHTGILSEPTAIHRVQRILEQADTDTKSSTLLRLG